VPIKLFIVTWQNEKALNDGLDSLFTNNNIDLEVNVIANHSAVKVHDEFQDKVNIIYNNLRLDESTGYLSRNWNQAILLGFKSLRNPACDVLIAAQDDTIYYKNWLKKLLKLHNKYSFITYGWGDNFCSYLPEAVKKVGLWDERFITTHHAAEYFYRMLILNRSW
jgi:GT2 family glycosyltransferase